MIMNLPPNWFLYPDYAPPDKTRFCGVLSIAYAIEVSRRSTVTKLVQHGRIRKWLSRRYVSAGPTRN